MPTDFANKLIHLSQVFAFYTVIINTDFKNIQKKGDNFQSGYSLLLYQMRITPSYYKYS